MVDLLLMYNGNVFLLPIFLQQFSNTYNHTKIGRKICVLDKEWNTEGVKTLLTKHSFGICEVDFYRGVQSDNPYLCFESWKAKVIDTYLSEELLGDNVLCLGSGVVPKSSHWLDIMWGHYQDEGACFFSKFVRRSYDDNTKYVDREYITQFYPNTNCFIINKLHYNNSQFDSFMITNVNKDDVRPVYGDDYSAQCDGMGFRYGVLGKYISSLLWSMKPYINGDFLFDRLFDYVTPFKFTGDRVFSDLSGGILNVDVLFYDYINILKKYNFSIDMFESEDCPSYYNGFYDFYLGLSSDVVHLWVTNSEGCMPITKLLDAELFFNFYINENKSEIDLESCIEFCCKEYDPDYVVISSPHIEVCLGDIIDLFVGAVFNGVAVKSNIMGDIVIIKREFVEESENTYEGLYKENTQSRKLLPERV